MHFVPQNTVFIDVRTRRRRRRGQTEVFYRTSTRETAPSTLQYRWVCLRMVVSQHFFPGVFWVSRRTHISHEDPSMYVYIYIYTYLEVILNTTTYSPWTQFGAYAHIGGMLINPFTDSN